MDPANNNNQQKPDENDTEPAELDSIFGGGVFSSSLTEQSSEEIAANTAAINKDAEKDLKEILPQAAFGSLTD